MEIIHTIASTRADHGGTSRSIPALSEALSANGTAVRLVTTAPAKPRKGAEPILPNGAVECRVIEENDGLRGRLRSPFAFQKVLQQEVQDRPPDLIHDHGAWLPSNRAASVVARHHDLPLVVSPRGMLTGWSLQHHGLKKRAAWHLYQRRVMARAALFHVTSEDEAEGLRQLGFEQPMAVIPNGATIPEAYKEAPSSGSERTALFLSRLHPKKGLPMLIEAWSEVQPEGWRLDLVGPDDGGHRAELEALVRTHGLAGDVTFAGPVDDAEKWDVYRRADLFVLPTHSENFGIVVAEALASGLPVITTQGAPWQELETHRCGWWTDIDAKALAKALEEATCLTDEQRLAMGQRGRALVEERYSWQHIAQRMQAVYQWILQRVEQPSCILPGKESLT